MSASTSRLVPKVARTPLSSRVSKQQTRNASNDLRVSHDGRPLIRFGPGGRSTTTGQVATVFGCTGFLGRYLVHKLAKQGTQVVIPYREEDDKRHLKVMGDLGQIIPMEWSLRNDTQIEECLRHSNVVYNLVGRDHETKNYRFPDVHVEGARRIARIAQQAGVARLIHVSHLNARHDSPSKFLRSKAEGEEAVSEAFPGSTIVRPGWLFGHEDRLLNTVARHPIAFRINNQETLIRPSHVLDVAEAMKIMMNADSTMGQTFSLGGPKAYTFEEIIAIAELETVLKLQGFNVPKFLASMVTRVWENVWWPTLSPDEITRRCMDDLPDEKGTLSWEYLGMKPDSLEELAVIYLRRHRSAQYYDRPSALQGGLKLRKPSYHTIE